MSLKQICLLAEHINIKDKAGNIKKTKIKRKYPDGAKSKKVIKGDKWKKVDRDGLKRTVTRGKITNDGGRKKLPEPDVKPIRPWEPKIMR